MTRTVETQGGQYIEITDDGTGWIGCGGEFCEDDLLDIVAALRGNYTEDDDDEEDD